MLICQSEILLQNKRFARFAKFIRIVFYVRCYSIVVSVLQKKRNSYCRKGRVEEYLSTSAKKCRKFNLPITLLKSNDQFRCIRFIVC